MPRRHDFALGIVLQPRSEESIEFLGTRVRVASLKLRALHLEPGRHHLQRENEAFNEVFCLFSLHAPTLVAHLRRRHPNIHLPHLHVNADPHDPSGVRRLVSPPASCPQPPACCPQPLASPQLQAILSPRRRLHAKPSRSCLSQDLREGKGTSGLGSQRSSGSPMCRRMDENPLCGPSNSFRTLRLRRTGRKTLRSDEAST